MTSWQDRFNAELVQAERARQNGNEGMARVCARRAAGIVAAEYIRRSGLSTRDLSAYDALRQLAAQADLPVDISQIIENMLVRISPDHTLPIPADLPADAVQLRRLLLGE